MMEGINCQWGKLNVMNTWFVHESVSRYSIIFMHMQQLSEILDIKTLTNDNLIEYHLRTLAKWTVCDCNAT